MTPAKPQSEPSPDSDPQSATEELLPSDRANPERDASATADESAAGLRSDWAAELDEAKQDALRSQAELENFRKRMRREMEEERRYACLPLVRDLLAVLDNMQRAIDAAEGSDGKSGLLEGVKMVSDQFLAVLEQHHCRPIPAIGSPFDPNLHEAIGQEPSNEYAANMVSRELRVGYQLHDRVARPSQVFVSTGPPDQSSG